MHPSKDIIGSYSNRLKGKTICICITGSVAAVNTPSLCREFMRHGAEVITVMTDAAKKIIHPDLLHWATGNEVVDSLSGKIEHIEIAGERAGKKGKADIIIVAPATANTISKIACGIDDTPVTTVVTTAFGSKTPIIIVPAMHESMYNHPILKENIKKLERYGVDFIMPRIEEGKAKIADNKEIVEIVINKLLGRQDLKGLRFIVTAGPSREMIDSVRFISNPSSGKMGIAIAREIINRGGEVTLINGKSSVDPPSQAKVINVLSVFDFVEAIKKELTDGKYDVLISAAALADFTPVKVVNEKISSEKDSLVIQLKSTPKLIKEARRLSKDLFIVAFKAETNFEGDELIEKAYRRLKDSEVNMIVANNVSMSDKDRGFESDTNEVFIIDDRKNVVHVELSSKIEVADKILDIISERFKNQ